MTTTDMGRLATEHIDVGIGEMAVSDSPNQTLITHALGSCIGLALYDPDLKIGGLTHSMLPLFSAHSNRTEPLMFTDKAVAALIQQLFDRGSRRENLIAKVAGASCQMDEGGLFRIGERNYAVLRRVLWKNSILIAGEDIGGTSARTLALNIATGQTTVRTKGVETEL